MASNYFSNESQAHALITAARKLKLKLSTQLNWSSSKTDDDWHWFPIVKLNQINDEGVYVIRNGLYLGNTLYVGQGNIAERLSEHKTTLRHKRYNIQDLWVAWATVSSENKNGVERFLYNYFKPIESKRCPEALPISVNLPKTKPLDFRWGFNNVR